MGHREYVDPLVNEITYICQIIITILAYFHNFLLIFIIHRSTRRDIGSYRILLTYFAISDIYYNTIHCVVYPIPETFDNVFIMRGHGVYSEFVGVSLYAGAYAHAFPILIFHFLYRLLAINYPQHLHYIAWFVVALVVSTAACNALWFTVFYWFFAPDEEILLVLTPIFNGSVPVPVFHTMDTAQKHAQALYWTGDTFEGPRWRNLVGIGIMCVTMASTYTFIICCSYVINKYLKEKTISKQSRYLHKQLFRSLIYQSFVPLFTAYYPAGTAIILPVLGITSRYVPIFVPPSCATHPLVDSLLLLLTITEYRRSYFAITGLSRLARTFGPKSIVVPTKIISSRASSISHSGRMY